MNNIIKFTTIFICVGVAQFIGMLNISSSSGIL